MGNIDIELILIKYLQFNSHHPSQHKPSVARTLLDRAKNVPAAETGRLSQVQHVVDALKINGFTDQFIRSSQRTMHLQTTEVLFLCRTFNELQKDLQALNNSISIFPINP